MKVREVVRILEDYGFKIKRWKGSHRQMEGIVNGQRHMVTVAGKKSDEVPRATLASIKRQSGLSASVFRK